MKIFNLRTKRGQVLVYGLIAGLIAAIIVSFVEHATTTKSFETIGDSSLLLLQSSKEAEKALFYIDQSAKYSAYQAFYDLANDGGCNEGDRYLGYSIWKDQDENSDVCNKNIEEVKNNFYSNLNENLNENLKKFESIDIPTDNYNLEVNNINLIGKPNKPLKIPIKKETDKDKETIGEYSIKPSFNVNINYDFSDYDLLRNKIKELQELCKDSDNLADCIDKNKIKILNDDEFTLLETCESEEKEKLLEFTEYFLSCLDSEVPDAEENEEILGCVCRNRPQGGTYNIILVEDDVIIHGNINEEEISIKLENTDSKGVELENIDDEKVLHKDKGTEALITFLDIPENPSCIVKPKTKFRFCVQSNKNEFLVFEEEDKQTKLRNIIYKFALDFGEKEIKEAKEKIEEELELTEKNKKFFEGERIFIIPECRDPRDRHSIDKIFDVANKLADVIPQPQAKVIIPVYETDCRLDLDNVIDKVLDSDIFLIITTENFNNGLVEYNEQSPESLELSQKILDSLLLVGNFLKEKSKSIDENLKLSDLSTKIIFPIKKLEEENNYAASIVSGLINYFDESIKNTEVIPSTSREVEKTVIRIAKEKEFSFPILAVSFAKQESSFDHCRQSLIPITKDLDCGTSKPDNVNCNKINSCGVMQLNKIHCAWFYPKLCTDKNIDEHKCSSSYLNTGINPDCSVWEAASCAADETALDLNCNIKLGLEFINQLNRVWGTDTERYENIVNKYCENEIYNEKYKSYTDPWDRALRAYNGFGCGTGADPNYVEKINNYITDYIEAAKS